MSGNLSAEIGEAMQRVERGTSNLANAKRRLTRSEQAVVTARADVASAEDELKAASAGLDAMILRNLKNSLRKGGAKMAVAIGDLMSRSLDGEGQPALADAGEGASSLAEGEEGGEPAQGSLAA